MAGALPQAPDDAHMVIGSGYRKRFEGEVINRYPDGTLRAFLPYPDAPPRQIWEIVYTDISWEQFEDIEAFWEARANATPFSAASFTFQHPITGATLTATFVTEGREIAPKFTASCRVSVTLVAEVAA